MIRTTFTLTEAQIKALMDIDFIAAIHRAAKRYAEQQQEWRDAVLSDLHAHYIATTPPADREDAAWVNAMVRDILSKGKA